MRENMHRKNEHREKSPVAISPFAMHTNVLWESVAMRTPSELSSPPPAAFGSPFHSPKHMADHSTFTARKFAGRFASTKKRQPLGTLVLRQELMSPSPRPAPFGAFAQPAAPTPPPPSTSGKELSQLSPSERDRLALGTSRLEAALHSLSPASPADSPAALGEAMDAECRILLGGVPEECAAKALSEFALAASRKKIRNPSGFLVRLITTALADFGKNLQAAWAASQAKEAPSPSASSGPAPSATTSQEADAIISELARATALAEEGEEASSVPAPAPAAPEPKPEPAAPQAEAAPPSPGEASLQSPEPSRPSPRTASRADRDESWSARKERGLQGAVPFSGFAGKENEPLASPLPQARSPMTPFFGSAGPRFRPSGSPGAPEPSPTPSRALRSPLNPERPASLARTDVLEAVKTVETKYGVTLTLDVRSLHSLDGLSPLAVTACLENVATAVAAGKVRNPSALLGTQAAKYHKDGARASPDSPYLKSPAQLIQEGLQALTPELRTRIQEITDGRCPGLRVEVFDAAVLTSLESLPLSAALELLTFSTTVQWRRVRNPSGFFMGLIRGKHAEVKGLLNTPSPLRN